MSIVISAVAAAVEIGSAALIATAVMDVGIAMTVVGAVTKSKELTKIGGVLSLAGGVASLAIGVTGALSGAAAGEAGAAGATGASAATGAATEAAGAVAGDTVATSGLEAATSGAQTFGIPDPSAGITDTLGGEIGESFASPISSGFDVKPPTLPGAVDAPALAPQAAAPQVTGTASAAPVDNSSMFNADMSGNDLTMRPLGGADQALPKPGMFQDIKEWYKGLTPDAQSRVGTALLQGGGMALAGLSKGWTEEQKLALEREKFNLTKEQDATKTANNNYAPTVAFKPIKPTGLIAGAQGAK